LAFSSSSLKAPPSRRLFIRCFNQKIAHLSVQEVIGENPHDRTGAFLHATGYTL
jgi:hypothetical protein